MFSHLNEQITLMPCLPQPDGAGGITIEWKKPTKSWACLTRCNIHFKTPAIPLWPPLPNGMVLGCYRIIMRQEEFQETIGKILWRHKTLYPIDMPAEYKNPGYISFKVIEISSDIHRTETIKNDDLAQNDNPNQTIEAESQVDSEESNSEDSPSNSEEIDRQYSQSNSEENNSEDSQNNSGGF
jgi:hypothetical protein